MLRFQTGRASEPTTRAQGSNSFGIREVLDEETFKRMIAIERKRTERSKEPFLLMLLEASHPQNLNGTPGPLERMVSTLLSITRDTDVIGWQNRRDTLGVLYTGLPVNNKNVVLSTILAKVSAALGAQFTSDELSRVTISFHFFPDEWDRNHPDHPNDPVLYPDMSSRGTQRRTFLAMKRTMDIFVSALILCVCSPLLFMVAIAVKLSSKGPVLFKQQRVGQYGRHFTFLKFRSMYIDNDESVHKEFVTNLIANGAKVEIQQGNAKAVYKLTTDKRVTRVGRLLRKTSLDELPQLLNVLKGEMSLVGPRPSIPYETEAYQTWHRRRVLEVKPGITGLWQVHGRSRVRFDEMVRLDLRYAMSWSPWVDFKILLQTPLAVIKGDGAC